MNEQLAQISPVVAQLWQASVTYLGQPWFAYQVAIIVALFIVARLLAARIEPRLEARARAIKGNPGLLRMMVALLRRTDLVLYTLLLGVALTLMRATTWPSRSYIISLVFTLAAAWLVISVLSRVIHSRMIARLVALGVWGFVAASVSACRRWCRTSSPASSSCSIDR